MGLLLLSGCCGCPCPPPETVCVGQPIPPRAPIDPTEASPPPPSTDTTPEEGSEAPPARSPEADRILKEGHAPTPFSAAEMQAACRPPRVDVQRGSMMGKQVTMTMTWLEGTETHARYVQENRIEEEGEEPSVARSESTASWTDLQGHASFPVELTTIREVEIETPAGRFPCWHYQVSTDDGRMDFWFAKALPGMPIKHVLIRGGHVFSELELVETTGHPAK